MDGAQKHSDAGPDVFFQRKDRRRYCVGVHLGFWTEAGSVLRLLPFGRKTTNPTWGLEPIHANGKWPDSEIYPQGPV